MLLTNIAIKYSKLCSQVRTENPALAAPNLHYVLASRHLERIADHATNIAEDILFWVRGLEVRHGRAKQMELNTGDAAAAQAE